MFIRATALAVEVWAPAKVNLFLEVLGRRDDGFHEIETLMCPVNLYDTLVFQAQCDGSGQGKAIRLSCDWRRGPDDGQEPAAGQLPEGTDNLVVRAVELLRTRAGIDAGATIRLVKRIPIAAGLGGGSSDAAAALVAANRAWGIGYPARRLAELAAQLGSDVPFFLASSAAVCRGRGERVQPLPRLGPLHLVVARPPAGLSTAEVYQACRPAGSPRRVEKLVEAISRCRADEVGRQLHNRLQEAAATRSPWIGRLEHEFSAQDFLGHLMSGSGTSYFGICRSARHARRAAARLHSRGVGTVYAVHGRC